MIKVAIVYHSGYGHTKKQAEAVHAGARAVDSAAELIAIDAEGNIPASAWDTLNAADAIVFGSPTYMGTCVVAVQEVCRRRSCLGNGWWRPLAN